MSIIKDRSLRGTLLAGCAAFAIGAVALGGTAQAQEVRDYSIAGQNLDSALRAFAMESGHDVVFAPALVQGKRTDGVRGRLTDQMALGMLLTDSGLRFEQTESGGFAIVQAGGGSGPQGAGAAGDGADVDALIVTAQKKEEAIQDVPIAISAFTQKSLDAQKIEGGFDLLKAIPNVTFSKNNFTGYNFSIRGVGTKAVSTASDPGVAVSFNNIALIHNRLFEQEYFDVERVEVLRGPQGTLYGRNATAGVINVISTKPRFGEFEADLKGEVGNFNARRLRGMVNLPIGDTLAVRIAGSGTQRDGYGTNLSTGGDVDGRNLWSLRTTVGWEPAEVLRANFLWEHFEEDDNRARTSKQLCHNDPGPATVDGVAVPNLQLRGLLSQGCKAGSLYDDGAFGTPNGLALPFIQGMFSVLYGYDPDPDPACPYVNDVLPALDPCQPDPYGNRRQSTDLREIESQLEPIYRANADVFELNVDLDLTESLTFSSQTALNLDEIFSSQDFNRFHTDPIFTDSSTGCAARFPAPCTPGTIFPLHLAPGGVYDDPQLGPSRSLVGMDISQSRSTQFTQEFRLASNFDGPVNFSAGANYTYFKTENDYYVFINLISMLAEGYFNFNNSRCSGIGRDCIYVDPNPLESINGEGHNYFRSQNPYKLNSLAAFGEVYWEVTPTVKLTAGLRWTSDRKVFTPHPSQTLLIDYAVICSDPCVYDPSVPQSGLTLQYGSASRGYPPEADIVQEWREPTGRLVVDWKPELGFTDETMLYASYSHGYKGGGANPPGIAPPAGGVLVGAVGAVRPQTFEPEYVDAFEIGTKNTLLDGSLILNAGAFYYDYEGYQVSKIVDRSAANENFDAKIWGAEFEATWSPIRNLRFNGTVGYLQTEIADGEQSIDLMDRTQGDPDWVTIKPNVFLASSCVAPAELVAYTLPGGSNYLSRFCPGGDLFGQTFISSPIPNSGGQFFNPAVDAPNFGAGFFADLGGNELPNAPRWTFSFGAQYSVDFPGGWRATLRGDYYQQADSFARVYNTEYDELRGWSNTNVSLWVENPEIGLTAEVYVKNATDEMPITDAFLNSDDTALTTNVFTLDPRLIGVSIRKSF